MNYGAARIFLRRVDAASHRRYKKPIRFVAINRQVPHPAAARLFTDFFLGAESQRIFWNLGEYVFHPEADLNLKKT